MFGRFVACKLQNRIIFLIGFILSMDAFASEATLFPQLPQTAIVVSGDRTLPSMSEVQQGLDSFLVTYHGHDQLGNLSMGVLAKPSDIQPLTSFSELNASVLDQKTMRDKKLALAHYDPHGNLIVEDIVSAGIKDIIYNQGTAELTLHTKGAQVYYAHLTNRTI